MSRNKSQTYQRMASAQDKFNRAATFGYDEQENPAQRIVVIKDLPKNHPLKLAVKRAQANQGRAILVNGIHLLW